MGKIWKENISLGGGRNKRRTHYPKCDKKTLK